MTISVVKVWYEYQRRRKLCRYYNASSFSEACMKANIKTGEDLKSGVFLTARDKRSLDLLEKYLGV